MRKMNRITEQERRHIRQSVAPGVPLREKTAIREALTATLATQRRMGPTWVCPICEAIAGKLTTPAR